MRSRIERLSVVATLVVSLAGVAAASELTIGAGSSLDLGSVNVGFGCADLNVAGTLVGNAGGLNTVRDIAILPDASFQGGASTVFLTGSWTNRGQFLAGTSSVNFTDGCGRTVSAVAGDSTFYDLEAQSIAGKILEFEAGSTTVVTGQLILAGIPGNRLRVRSSVTGVEAFLDIRGEQILVDVEVQDSHAIGKLALIGPGSEKLGNANGWWAAYAVPAVGVTTLAALAGSVLYVGRRTLRHRGRAGA